jgi:hypothetical protein
VWDVNKFQSLKEIEGVVNFEPYLNLRGHKSPIISLTGTNQNSSNPFTDNLILSGSKNGVIKAWRVPN